MNHGPHGPFGSICLPEQLTGLKATDLFITKEIIKASDKEMHGTRYARGSGGLWVLMPLAQEGAVTEACPLGLYRSSLT